jgi:hypothetical protein
VSRVETDLRALALLVEWPDTPEVAADVAALIAAPPARRRTSRRLGLALALVLLAVVVAMAVPPARSAILDWLGLGSARIERVDELPALQLTAPVELLGQPTTLADARRRAGFPVAPPPRGEAAPDEVRVVDGRRVSYVWLDGDRIRLLVTQVPGLLQRGAILGKLIPPSATIERFEIDGDGAVFLSGGPHAVYLLGPSGSFEEDHGWLAGNTLLVDRGGATLRIEGELDRERAVEFAREIGPRDHSIEG